MCEEDEEKSGGIPLDDISGAFIIVSVGILVAVIGRVWIKSFGILLDLTILGLKNWEKQFLLIFVSTPKLEHKFNFSIPSHQMPMMEGLKKYYTWKIFKVWIAYKPFLDLLKGRIKLYSCFDINAKSRFPKLSFPFLIKGLYVEKLYYGNLAPKSATVTPVSTK